LKWTFIFVQKVIVPTEFGKKAVLQHNAAKCVFWSVFLAAYFFAK